MKNKRALVTGADGFIGSHLVERLARDGAKVRALALYNSFNDWGWLEGLDPALGVEVVTGDIRDKAQVSAITKGVDVVFHLASLIAIPYSYVAPESYVQTNVQGTLNVVQAALEHGVKRVVHTSTSEVYGTALKVPISENHPLQPQSPYSATKIAADSIAMSFYHAFRLPVVIARPFNTYGPRQSARAVIPSLLIQALSGRKSVKLGKLSPTRDFNYVLDTCEGLLALGQCDAAIGRTVNIGSGSEVSIRDLVRLVQRLLAADFEVQEDAQRVRPSDSEVERLVCDSSQLRALTGWKPKIDLTDGLKRTIEWLSEPSNLRRYKVDTYNR